MIFSEPPDDPRYREGWFYMWIGLCLTRWGYVHEGLYEVCFSILNTTAQHTAIIFYRTPNFDSRLSLTNELVEACFPPRKPGEHETHQALKDWRKIHGDLLNLSPIRNALAHQRPNATGEPIQAAGERGGEPQFVDLLTMTNIAREGLEIRLSRSEEMRGRKVKVMAVGDTELPGHYTGVEDVSNRLFEFNRALRAHLKQQAKSAE